MWVEKEMQKKNVCCDGMFKSSRGPEFLITNLLVYGNFVLFSYFYTHCVVLFFWLIGWSFTKKECQCRSYGITHTHTQLLCLTCSLAISISWGFNLCALFPYIVFFHSLSHTVSPPRPVFPSVDFNFCVFKIHRNIENLSKKNVFISTHIRTHNHTMPHNTKHSFCSNEYATPVWQTI